MQNLGGRRSVTKELLVYPAGHSVSVSGLLQNRGGEGEKALAVGLGQIPLYLFKGDLVLRVPNDVIFIRPEIAEGDAVIHRRRLWHECLEGPGEAGVDD